MRRTLLVLFVFAVLVASLLRPALAYGIQITQISAPSRVVKICTTIQVTITFRWDVQEPNGVIVARVADPSSADAWTRTSTILETSGGGVIMVWVRVPCEEGIWNLMAVVTYDHSESNEHYSSAPKYFQVQIGSNDEVINPFNTVTTEITTSESTNAITNETSNPIITTTQILTVETVLTESTGTVTTWYVTTVTTAVDEFPNEALFVILTLIGSLLITSIFRSRLTNDKYASE